MNILIVLLLIILIVKDYIPTKRGQKAVNTIKDKEVLNESERAKIEAIQREFDGIMSYSVEDAIKNKRGE